VSLTPVDTCSLGRAAGFVSGPSFGRHGAKNSTVLVRVPDVEFDEPESLSSGHVGLLLAWRFLLEASRALPKSRNRTSLISVNLSGSPPDNELTGPNLATGSESGHAGSLLAWPFFGDVPSAVDFASVSYSDFPLLCQRSRPCFVDSQDRCIIPRTRFIAKHREFSATSACLRWRGVFVGSIAGRTLSQNPATGLPSFRSTFPALLSMNELTHHGRCIHSKDGMNLSYDSHAASGSCRHFLTWRFS